MSRRARFAVLTLIAALVLAGAGCGSSSRTSSTQAATSLPKTKFVLHTGLAFGAFHHFIYKPYKAGTLTGGGLLSHKLTKVEAGLAGLFAYHEIKLALTDAQSSPLLRRLVSPLTALSGALAALGAKIQGGTIDGAAIDATNTQVGSAGAAARAAGQPITETTPSAGALAGG